MADPIWPLYDAPSDLEEPALRAESTREAVAEIPITQPLDRFAIPWRPEKS